MNGISTDALVGLAGVALGALVSLIIMWFEGKRESRRIADQRRYERAKDRVDKLEPYIAQLHHLSNKIRESAEGIFSWVRFWSRIPPSERRPVSQNALDDLQRTLKDASAVQEQDLGIILDSLEPQILDGFHELRKFFGTLRMLASAFFSEQEWALASPDPDYIDNWAEQWRRDIVTTYAAFEGAYKTLVIAIGNLLEHPCRRPSWVERLRQWWGRRG